MDELEKKIRRLCMAIISIENTEQRLDSENPTTSAELALLYVLSDGNAYSQKVISKVCGISRTTLNSMVKRWEKDGLLFLTKIPGKSREMNVCLTEKGKDKADSSLKLIFTVEKEAMRETIEKYSDIFIEALEHYEKKLKESVEKSLGSE